MKILDNLPIPTTETMALVREESVRLKGSQIIVWVSLSPIKAVEWNPITPCFPAILDTGHTHNFAIQEQHLIRWAGIRPEMLRLLGHIRHSGKRMPLQAANLWLHHNSSGKTDVSPHQSFLCNLPSGIVVYPDGEKYPRLPLLGLRALTSSKLYLAIDGEHKSVNLRTPDLRTRMLRWFV